MAQCWYVVRTEPRAEYFAASELQVAGYEVFLPCAKTPHPRPGHTDAPLFPGYLFLRCNLAEDTPAFVRVAPHALGWVSFRGEVPHLPDEFVALLIRRLDTIREDGGLWRRFRRGEIVRIVAGNVQQLAEVLEEPKSPQARVRVLLDFMGRSVPVQVPWENLRLVEEEPDLHDRSPRRTRGRGRWIRGFGERVVPVT